MGFPSPLRTLHPVLSLSLASTAPWFSLDFSPATSGGKGPDPEGRRYQTLVLWTELCGTVSSMPGHLMQPAGVCGGRDQPMR